MRAWMAWSSGKDSTFALHTARASGEVEVVGLLTTLNESADRVSMHSVRRELLEAQAERLGLPLHVVGLPDPCPNEVYEARMATAIASARDDGIEAMVFGDLFLEDVRAYREGQLAPTGIEPVFPLWRVPTDELAADMLVCGVRAIIIAVDTEQIDAGFVGREWDRQLIAELPAGADPCGERGEFHTFVFAGPGFSSPIDVQVGETRVVGSFAFADVLPR